jgi:deoxyribodipyrimidine photo-lyase
MAPAKRAVMLDGLRELRTGLRARGGDLIVRSGAPADIILPLLEHAAGVYVTRRYEPPGVQEDEALRLATEARGKEWREFKDRVLFEREEIVTARARRPYTVFTPYKHSWRARQLDIPPPLPAPRNITVPALVPGELPTTRAGGNFPTGGEKAARRAMAEFFRHGLGPYHQHRDLVAVPGTSRLSHHLATGTIGPRTLYHEFTKAASALRGLRRQGAQAFLDELIWREFYYQILANFPHVSQGAFKPQFDRIAWSRNEKVFAEWCSGRTGVPIVDAAMRQLVSEGWMHNRARMVTASFLTKDLHIDWRWGEQFFMSHLADGDLALNNGGWQWAAGTGTDASPWFRIFNPLLQAKKFDPDGMYVRRYVPELSRIPARWIHQPWTLTLEQRQEYTMGADYPTPIVDHDRARKATLVLYAAAARAAS